MRNIQRIFLSWIMVTLIAGPAVAETPVVPLKKDDPAPHTGLLVPEGRFTKLLQAEIDAQRLAGEIQIQKDLTANLEQVYSDQLREAVKPLKWYEKPAFNRWLGFGIGVVVSALAIWGGTELVKAMR